MDEKTQAVVRVRAAEGLPQEKIVQSLPEGVALRVRFTPGAAGEDWCDRWRNLGSFSGPSGCRQTTASP